MNNNKIMQDPDIQIIQNDELFHNFEDANHNIRPAEYTDPVEDLKECVICLSHCLTPNGETDNLLPMSILSYDLICRECECDYNVHKHCFNNWLKRCPACPICHNAVFIVDKPINIEPHIEPTEDDHGEDNESFSDWIGRLFKRYFCCKTQRNEDIPYPLNEQGGKGRNGGKGRKGGKGNRNNGAGVDTGKGGSRGGGRSRGGRGVSPNPIQRGGRLFQSRRNNENRITR